MLKRLNNKIYKIFHKNKKINIVLKNIKFNKKICIKSE